MRILTCICLSVILLVSAHAESVYDRVMKSGKIRVCYGIYPPGVIKDPNTGKLSGIVVDALNKAAENLQLKVEYTEEVPWGNMIEAIQANRADVALYFWANAARARVVDFSIPLFYSAINAYARPDDARFSKGLYEAMKDPSVAVSVIDGEMCQLIAKMDFPNTKMLSIGQGDVSTMILNVANKKADVVFIEEPTAREFLKHNPGKLKNITPGKPLRIFPNTIMFRRNEMEFGSMLNRALEELHNSGFIEALINKYELFPGSVYKNALPYQLKP